MSHPFDLSPLTLNQLECLANDVAKSIRARKDSEQLAALEAARAAAEALGYNLDEIHGPGGKPKNAAYVDPADPRNTWIGRGRRPKWLNEKLKNGANLDDFKA